MSECDPEIENCEEVATEEVEEVALPNGGIVDPVQQFSQLGSAGLLLAANVLIANDAKWTLNGEGWGLFAASGLSTAMGVYQAFLGWAPQGCWDQLNGVVPEEEAEEGDEEAEDDEEELRLR